MSSFNLSVGCGSQEPSLKPSTFTTIEDLKVLKVLTRAKYPKRLKTRAEVQAVENKLYKGIDFARNKIKKTVVASLIELGVEEAEAKEFVDRNIIGWGDVNEAVYDLYHFRDVLDYHKLRMKR
jgi:hypothetical protein